MDNINGKIVKHYREQKKLDIRQLAAIADVSESTILAIEKGRNKAPSTTTVAKLAKALDVKITDFWGRLEVVRD